jgi:hypothetical protein
MATTTLMLMTTPTFGRVVQSNQLTILLVVVHCVEEAGKEKKRKGTVQNKMFSKGYMFMGGGGTLMVYTVKL